MPGRPHVPLASLVPDPTGRHNPFCSRRHRAGPLTRPPHVLGGWPPHQLAVRGIDCLDLYRSARAQSRGFSKDSRSLSPRMDLQTELSADSEGLNGAVSHSQRTLQSKEDRPTKKKHLPAMHVAFQPSSQRSSRGMVVHIPRRRPAILRIQASRYSGGEQILHTVHNLLPHSYAQQCR